MIYYNIIYYTMLYYTIIYYTIISYNMLYYTIPCYRQHFEADVHEPAAHPCGIIQFNYTIHYISYIRVAYLL